jgi:cytoplasmic iron level regulating protein YaaA (DUF328/UPF0246 family)
MATRAAPIGILLPPSEGKADGGSGLPWSAEDGRFGHLAAQRTSLVTALKAQSGGSEKLLGVGGKHLAAAQQANSTLADSATLPAWRRYTGVVWNAMDVASLPGPARRRAMSSVVVVSGLLGLVGLDDPTPEYRLKMGAALVPQGKLSTWWRPLISEALTTWGARRFVVDLLPNEHRAACTNARLNGVSISFVERHGKIAGHDAKAAKGRLARHLLTSTDHPLAALESWSDARFNLLMTPIGR